MAPKKLRPVIKNLITKGGVLSEEKIIQRTNVERIDVYEGVTPTTPNAAGNVGIWLYTFPQNYGRKTIFGVAHYIGTPDPLLTPLDVTYNSSGFLVSTRQYLTHTVSGVECLRTTTEPVGGIPVRVLIYVLQDSFIQ